MAPKTQQMPMLYNAIPCPVSYKNNSLRTKYSVNVFTFDEKVQEMFRNDLIT